jgi:DNA polymerase I
MKRLIVVDISSFIFRAFYAIRPLTAPDGTPVNAVHGVLSMMTKLISEYGPTHMIIARDTRGGSFRKEIYPEYKANRSAPPEELIPQFSLIQELMEKMHLPTIQIENYEADDIIGSVATQLHHDFDEVLIASSDKDLMQFVNDKVKMVDTMKGVTYGPAGVFEKMGVRPDQIVDYLSLLGDASDNIPGVKGIGAKGASKLLAEYDTLEKCIENVENFKNKRLITGLTEHVGDAYLSKKLVQIVTDLDLNTSTEALELNSVVDTQLIDYLKGLGFTSAIKKLESALPEEKDVEDGPSKIEKKEIVVKTIINLNKEILEASSVAIYFTWKFRDNYQTPLENFGLSTELGANLLESEDLLKEFLLTYEGRLIGHDCKEILNYCHWNKITPKFELFDLSLAHFLINPSKKHTLDFMVEEFLGNYLEEQDSAGTLSYHVQTLQKDLEEELKELELLKIYNEIDLPLLNILSKMEVGGVNLNTDFYSELEVKFEEELSIIKSEIDSFTEEEVNLKSPKQVGKLLFEDLDLPVIKKTKTGFSTDAEVLTTLVQMDVHVVPGLLLKFRELDKLLSTYIKALPKLINEKTGKLHTTFQQSKAATGRLSSDHPNLQNIPVRTPNGKLLRKGFFASPGHKLITADYSQVELRILAHFSNDEIMLDTFKKDLDIHRQTASEIFNISLDAVTAVERSSAKAINFGLMYGQSSFGLSKQLGISRKEAKEYITFYFERFHKVKSYLDSLKEICEEKGYAETMHGRKRFLPDINSTNRTIKAMAERVAINSPIQGTAADIIKIAMVNIDKRLSVEKLQSKMILQVHDELIFDVPEAEIQMMEELITNEMENAVKLQIHLKVDSGIGENWYDLK